MTTALTTTLVVMLLAAGEPPSVGVMDFAANGASAELTSAASGLTTHELERLGVFRVFSSETLRVVLGVERQRALLGCEDCSGASLTDMSNFQYVLTGKVTAVGKAGPWTLVMTLLEVGKPQPVSSVTATAATEAALLGEVGPATIRLVGKLLAGRQGQLLVTTHEVGAAVKIDDTQVGTTPLPVQSLSAGPHLVSVEKEGFSAVRKEIRIQPDELGELQVGLVPSPDTIERYESAASRTRILAWVATGLSVAGTGLFVGGQIAAGNLYGSPNVAGTFEFHRAALLAGKEVEGDVNHRSAANQLKSEIELWQTLSWVGAGVGVAGAIAATVLFVIGDEPGRYDAFRSAGGVTLQLAPGLGGAAVVGTF